MFILLLGTVMDVTTDFYNKGALVNICSAMQKSCGETIKPGWNSSVNAAHWKLWKLSNNPNNPINPARESYLKAKREFHKALRAWIQDQDFSFNASLDLNRLLRNKSGTQPNLTNRILIDNQVYSGNRILEGWAKHFENLGQPFNHDFDTPFSTKLMKSSRIWHPNLRSNLIPYSLKSLKKSTNPSILCNWEQHLVQTECSQNIYAMVVVHDLSILYNLIENHVNTFLGAFSRVSSSPYQTVLIKTHLIHLTTVASPFSLL